MTEAPAPSQEDVFRRTTRSLKWSLVSSPLRVLTLLLQSIFLARWVPIEVFGAFGFAGALTTGTLVIGAFGLNMAFLHRAPETEDEQRAANVLFTLRLLMLLPWLVAMLSAARWLLTPDRGIALAVLAITHFVMQLAEPARLILTRRVVHRRLVMVDLGAVLLSSVIAVYLAWRGFELTAVLSTVVVTSLVQLVGLGVVRPAWLPRFAWDPMIVRYYLRFGSRSMTAGALNTAIDRVDDLFTGFFLGDFALGIYSRAYRFATYPRTIIAQPFNAILRGTFAELKHERERLSRAFFRFTALLARSGFLLVGLFGLLAPEFVHYALTDKWAPMVPVFRLMLVFSLLDPVRQSMVALLFAIGQPERVMRVHGIQLAALVLGMILLSPALEIVGVALAVDVAMLVGIVLLMRVVHEAVDISWPALWGPPLIALAVALATPFALDSSLGPATEFDLVRATWRVLSFCLSYVAVLALLERRRLPELWRHARRALD